MVLVVGIDTIMTKKKLSISTMHYMANFSTFLQSPILENHQAFDFIAAHYAQVPISSVKRVIELNESDRNCIVYVRETWSSIHTKALKYKYHVKCYRFLNFPMANTWWNTQRVYMPHLPYA